MSIQDQVISTIAGLGQAQSLNLTHALGEATTAEAVKGLVETGVKVATGLVGLAAVKCGAATFCASAAVAVPVLGSLMVATVGMAAPVVSAMVMATGSYALKAYETAQVDKYVSQASAERGAQILKGGHIKTLQDKTDIHALLVRDTASYRELDTKINFGDQNAVITGSADKLKTETDKAGLQEQQRRVQAEIELAIWTAKKGGFLPKKLEVAYKHMLSPSVRDALVNQDKAEQTIASFGPSAYAMRPTKVRMNYTPMVLSQA